MQFHPLIALFCLNLALSPAAAAEKQVFLAPERAPVAGLIAAPPGEGSARQKSELAELHRIQAERTPSEEQAARADAEEKTVAAFSATLGVDFAAQAPRTARLAAHVAESSEIYVRAAKTFYRRPHPYQVDAGLHPACPPKKPVADESYPSGHALRGWLLALTLAELAPEKRDRILARAEGYAHNRLICGVHYPSDIEASKALARALYPLMARQRDFRRELAAARQEWRSTK